MVNAWPKPKKAGAVAVAILEAATADPVLGEMPTTRPARFYVVSVLGGDFTNPAFSEPRVLVEAWAGDSDTAEDMCLTAMQAFQNARGKSLGGAFVYQAKDFQGPTDFNDPDIQDRRRSQFHCTLPLSTR